MTAQTPPLTGHNAPVPDPLPPRPRQERGASLPRRTNWWLRRLYSAALALLVGVLLIAGVGLAQRLGWITAGGGGGSSASGDAGQEIHTCPMHPQVRQPGPGRCFICGMELVPAAAGTADLDELSVQIEPAQRRLAQIRTEPVVSRPVSEEIQSVGSIAIDESRMATISSYISGRIERLFADYTGVDVAKGDHLAVIYSPQLYAAQVEYLEARKSLPATAGSALDVVRQAQQKLAESARQRLVELGMTADQITALEQSGAAQSRLTIYAPIGGTVTEKQMVEGDYVETGQPIYRIANLTTVWLMLELFPEDATRIRFGQRVRAAMQSLPGETYEGRVAFIDPTVDPGKRTVGVRVEFLNEDRRLRPGDYATATITLPIGPLGEVYDAGLAGKWISPMHPQIIRDEPGTCPICGMDLVPTTRYGYSATPVEQPPSLVIPRSAVLLAGETSVVYAETAPGRFEIRLVTLGPILRDHAIIIDGVEEGEQVAAAGNFLIDSQMQLSGKPSLIDPTRVVAARLQRTSPLEHTTAAGRALSGPTGEQLEQMYGVYFRIQRSLASDKSPSERDADTLHELAAALATSAELDERARGQLHEIATRSQHLAHLPVDRSRLDAFRPISHAVLTLAARHRGADARQPYYHMFCPMVKGGGGDWLQPDDDLRNPYWGSQMPTCGEVVRPLAPPETGGPPAQAAEGPSTPLPQEN